MTQQTAIEWLITERQKCGFTSLPDLLQAQQMERDRRKEDFKIGYNQGYLDAQCNHVNDADNFAEEQDYINQ